LFNSSEKRLARALLLLANFGKDGRPEPIIAKVSQETLAEMIGTCADEATAALWSCPARSSGRRLQAWFGNLLTFFPSLGKPNGDGLLSALYFSALTAFSAFQLSALKLVHFAFNVFRCAT
jgi:hypothetical protein